MRIKIISDGTPKNTKVVDADTGELVKDVYAIQWSCDVHNLARAIIGFINVPVEVEAETVETKLIKEGE
jgi:hypothetical protein